MSALYMLDTDTVSYSFRGYGQVAARMAQHVPSELCVSALTVAQLRFGAIRRQSRSLDGFISELTTNLAVMPFDQACGNQYGIIAAELADRGEPIGHFDTLIAAHAMALGLTLVTNNVRHFQRIPNLRVENWT